MFRWLHQTSSDLFFLFIEGEIHTFCRAILVFLALQCDVTQPPRPWSPSPAAACAGCSRSQRMQHGAVLMASGAGALSPSSQCSWRGGWELETELMQLLCEHKARPLATIKILLSKFYISVLQQVVKEPLLVKKINKDKINRNYSCSLVIGLNYLIWGIT